MEYMFTNTKQTVSKDTGPTIVTTLCEHLPFLSSVPPGKFM